MKDGLVLFYCKEGTLYPVVLNEDQRQTFEIMGHLLEPIKVLDLPQGTAINLKDWRNSHDRPAN